MAYQTNLNKTITLEKGTGYTTKYGANPTDGIPSVFYLRSKAKIGSKEMNRSYVKEVRSIKREFGNYVNKYVESHPYFSHNYLFNIDISESSVGFHRESFLRYDIYLKPRKKGTVIDHKEEFVKTSIDLDKKLNEILEKNGIVKHS